MQMFPHPTPAQPAQPPLVDNMFAPEIATAGVSGMSLVNGVLTITLESVRCDHTKANAPLERVVVGRVAASIPAAQTLLAGLYDFLASHGLNPLAGNPQTQTCQ